MSFADLNQYAGTYSKPSEYDWESLLTFEWYADRITALSPAGTLLELGIGYGATIAKFSSIYERYVILEGSDGVISSFRRQYALPHLEIVHTLFECYETGDQFDMVVMGFVLEHVDDPALILKRFARFLKPTGRLYVTVPNAKSLHRRIGFEAKLLPDLYQLGDRDRMAGHQRYFDRDSIIQLIESCGYTVSRVEGIFLKPITTAQMDSLHLSREVIHAMFRVGVGYPELCNCILIQAMKKG